jgi:hypothetical protein
VIQHYLCDLSQDHGLLEEKEEEEGEEKEIEDAKKTVKSRARSLLIRLRGKEGQRSLKVRPG